MEEIRAVLWKSSVLKAIPDADRVIAMLAEKRVYSIVIGDTTLLAPLAGYPLLQHWIGAVEENAAFPLPDPRHFSDALELLYRKAPRLDTENIAYVGDAEVDIEAASAAKLCCIITRTGEYSHKAVPRRVPARQICWSAQVVPRAVDAVNLHRRTREREGGSTTAA